MTGDFKLLSVVHQQGVDFVTINNPPVNLLDAQLTDELLRYTARQAECSNVKVIVFNSADPDFFIARADLQLFQNYRDEVANQALLSMYELIERFHAWGKVTIGQLAGRASGAGSEFLMALDMRFAAIGKAFIRHPEVSLGLLPCKGGTQLLPRLVGRSRALEMMLSGQFYNAEQLEAYGYVNRAVMPVALDAYVRKLAIRIASAPAAAIANAKRAVNLSTDLDHSLFADEHRLFHEVVGSPDCQQRVGQFLKHINASRQTELEMDTRQWGR
ncbi:enoyl-CoA hydratase/isomerase family protein [Pseudomonas fluorescens]|uniref:enoyl-CoA hydratase/isomerase family protein n=1 Tax=Pseudomonas TaxID=286 RepID=UPI000812B809|nr:MULTISPECIES: enoyl-CoA hydratase/isomerase family protein [Pseudomonas]MBD8100191.1 enoyl-CoA hydratase/isomerase family protein [Pseudomonas fluorescens]MBD8776810.1 enoyl-CoA hydratase/isomerase family protein [Pseudomonas fluorescens]MBD8781847.1 enoyl-CoA hydratase/isomerase family protein [Pseudomonas fluorescens]MBD8798401.1 enoyl-CoA hydratase/isomerase family protein [Pseudomonas fluorescens]CRM45443.1 putative enoyl-CoA hydratase echA8 [Pseudomonas sp. 37 R 15]